MLQTLSLMNDTPIASRVNASRAEKLPLARNATVPASQLVTNFYLAVLSATLPLPR